MRVAELDLLTARLNAACGRPSTVYSTLACSEVYGAGKVTLSSVANLGCIHVRSVQDGCKVRYRLVVVINEAGGIQTVAGPRTASSMYRLLYSMCIGAELVRSLPTKPGVMP